MRFSIQLPVDTVTPHPTDSRMNPLPRRSWVASLQNGLILAVIMLAMIVTGFTVGFVRWSNAPETRIGRARIEAGAPVLVVADEADAAND